MGLKRKASVLDESAYQFQEQQSSSSPVAPSLTYSSPASTNTISPTHDSRGTSNTPYSFWKIEAVPYLSSRTRKRYRDNRPEEEIIHENTLRKLYDAQRLHLDEALPISEVVDMRSDGQGGIQEEDIDMTDQADAELPQSPQQNQRTLEAFFGGRSMATPPTHQAGASEQDTKPDPSSSASVTVSPSAWNYEVQRPLNEAFLLQPKQQRQAQQQQQQQSMYTMWSQQGYFQPTALTG
ncbi:hypothetical protein RBB50_002925 [Rhinocladiella similis]